MKILTTGQLCKKFEEEDKDTFLRKRNLRNFIRTNNVKYHMFGPQYLIDIEDFMNKVNPKNITQHYEVPKIRTMTSAVREFNKFHYEQINIHIIEELLKNNPRFSYQKGTRFYLINYDELEKEILLQLSLKRRRHYRHL